MEFEANGYVCFDEDLEVYDWFGLSAFSPGQLQEALDKLPDGEELTININSQGGSMFAGFEMYSRLKDSGKRTAAVVQSLAASAASTLAMGCGEVRVSPVGQIMIHRSGSCQEGNAADMQQMARSLRSFDESILNAYQLKCGEKTDRSKLRSLMNAETWLTAQDAVAVGLADVILHDEGGVLTNSVMNLAGDGMRRIANSAAPMNLEQMRAEYRRQKGTGAEDEEENKNKLIAATRWRTRNKF